jgi:SAM-dependent methyltransferase
MKLYEATPEGYVEKGSFPLDDHEDMSGATAPVVAGQRLYVREDSRLFCFDIRRRDSTEDPAAQPHRVALPELAPAAAGLRTTSDPASDPRRIANSVYSPTPHDVVAKMLALAEVEKEDIVFDLGSGDGRIVIAAAKKYGCRAVGYELDRELVQLSRQKAREAGVEDRVTFHQADLFTADLTCADVVALYLLPIQNERLIPQLKRLPAGARIISHQFQIPGVTPNKVIDIESVESGESHRLSLITAPIEQSATKDPRK